MTRIETVFGGLLAAGILAVFAFVFFGSPPVGGGTGAKAAAGDQVRSRSVSVSRTSLSGLLSDDPEDYVMPTTACECYYLGYDMVRERSIGLLDVTYEGQVQTCYEAVGQLGAAALERGALDAFDEPRQRRSCRPGDYS